jgi:hypothetical protein
VDDEINVAWLKPGSHQQHSRVRPATTEELLGLS